MSRPLGDLGKSTSFIKSLSRQMESVNEYTMGLRKEPRVGLVKIN